MKKILLVEDDQALATATSFALETENFNVTHCSCLADAKKALENDSFSLMLLDVNLPDGIGYTFCQEVRRQGHKLPIIFLTALDEEVNVVQGLEVGGDDYVCKPFRVRELISRIKANIRRFDTTADVSSEIILGPFKIDEKKHIVSHNGTILNLTPSEYRLFLTLVQNKNNVLTRGQILEQLWDIDGDFIDDNTLSVYVKRLREKLGEDKDYIQTIRGVGYMLQDK